ncbi:MAG TPA: serine hydrolase [Methylovirgula sp.]
MQAALKGFRDPRRASSLGLVFCLIAGLGFSRSAAANPAIVIDAASGNVVYAEEATQPWFPASITKLMTFYVALEAVREHKISLDTPIMMSARAARAVPSKMGFNPGTELTLGNALKMMVVKSANDLAIAVAEAVDGSVEAFADDMNANAAKLGMRQSHFVNPNGLPDPEHYSSAHDLAVLARAIILTYPQEAGWFGIGALRFGDEIIRNHNKLLGRYPGVDGMKTGFTCAAGFNLVVTSLREGHRYIAVVLGAPNPRSREMKMAVLLDRAFDGIDHPQTTLAALDVEGSGTPPDMHNSVCRRRGKALAAFQAETVQLEAPLLARKATGATAALPFLNGGAGADLTPVAPMLATISRPVFDPTPISLGVPAGYQGPVAAARPANSPIGTPPPVQQAASAEEAKKLENVATSDAQPPKAHHHLAHRHRAHKKVAHNRTHRKVAHRAKEKAIIVENKAASHASEAEREKPKAVAHAAKQKVSGKHAAVKKKPAVRHVKKAAPKKHLAKHVAVHPMQLEGGKVQSTKAAAGRQ